MESTVEEMKTSKKFNGLENDLFSIIPGIENASAAPFVLASELTEKLFYKNWVSLNKPCLIKGAVKDWPAIQKFKKEDYWLSVCEDFKIQLYPHMNHMVMERQLADRQDTTFHEAIKRLYSNTDYILSMPSKLITKDNHFAALLKELPGFTFLSNDKKPRMYDQRRFFLYRRASTAWHYHWIDETLMCQISGVKKVAIFPPHIPNEKRVTEFFQKELYLEGETLENPDLKPMIAYVQEGDALYIPPYWHHAVVPDDGEVGFTYAHCWKSPLHKFGDFSNYYVRRFYSGGLWPVRKISFLLPFLALYSGIWNGCRKAIK